MALHSMVVFLLLAGHLCCTSQTDASTPRGVLFGQQGDLSRVVFELQEDVPYRLEAGPDPTLIRIIFPTLRFTPKLQVARARTGLIQEVRWSTNGSQVMADIVLKQPGTVQHAARLHAPPRVVVDLARRNDGEVQQESEGTKGQGKVAAAPRVTDAHPQGGTATPPPQAASPTAQTPPLPPVSTLTPTQLLERAEKQWVARQLDAAQRSYTAFLQRYPEHPSNHLMAARVADILRAQAHYRAALEAYVVVVQGYPGSEGAVVVVTPEPTSITDAYALMKVLCTKYDEKHFKVIMNNVAHANEAKQAFRRLHLVAERFLNVSIDYLGFILHDTSFSQAVRQQKALLDIYPSSVAAPGFRALAQQLLATPEAAYPKGGIQFFWQRLLARQKPYAPEHAGR
jgi:hypothetical protein